MWGVCVCVCVCVLGKEVIMLECKFITLGLCMLWVVQVIFSWFKQKYSGILFPARKVFEKSQSIIILVIYLDHYQYFLHLKKSVTGRHFVTFLFFFFFFGHFKCLKPRKLWVVGNSDLLQHSPLIALTLRHIHKHLHFLNG